MDLPAVQSFMLEHAIDGWLIHDFRGNNPVLAQVLPGKRWTTRRVEMFIPCRGEPVVLAHFIDADQFKSCGVRCEKYLRWQEYREWLAARASSAGRIAVEYSPGSMLPVMSIVDAGTVELMRSLGAEVVSSA